MTSIGTHKVRFARLSQIVRQRRLPSPGEVLVQVGDQVVPEDVIARASVDGPIHVIDIAAALETSTDAAMRHIRVSIGDDVPAGAELAQRRSLFRKLSVEAPCNGVVRDLHHGMLFLRQRDPVVALRAYIPGEVIEVYPQFGAAVRATGAYVRAVWGSGGSACGVLAVMTVSPAEELTWERVSLRYRGAIIVGGTLQDRRVLLRANQFRLGGIIVGSMAPELFATASSLHVPVIVTEGLGAMPMVEPIYEMLHAHHGHPVVINGGAGDAEQPEAFVPIEANLNSTALVVTRPPRTGAHVRLTRYPYLGTIAEIVALSDTPQETAIGTMAEGATVRLPDSRQVFVPYVNLEVID